MASVAGSMSTTRTLPDLGLPRTSSWPAPLLLMSETDGRTDSRPSVQSMSDQRSARASPRRMPVVASSIQATCSCPSTPWAGRSTGAPARALWDFLFPKRGQLFELLGPWGMYREGKPYYDPALQAMHENHIHASAYASGTNSARPGYALVGEQGPELVRFRGGEQVYDPAATRRYVTAGGAAGGAAPVFSVDVNAVLENPVTGEQVTAHVKQVAVTVADAPYRASGAACPGWEELLRRLWTRDPK